MVTQRNFAHLRLIRLQGKNDFKMKQFLRIEKSKMKIHAKQQNKPIFFWLKTKNKRERRQEN